MAEFKRRTLILSGGKQIKLYGNSMAIGPSLEIGEGGAPNIFSQLSDNFTANTTDKSTSKIANPYQLSAEELHDLADYNIQLWMDLKTAIRKYGVENSRVFKQE
jgi:hypothetical protein